MKYERARGFDRVVICCGMEGGERYRHDNPVLIGIDAVDQDDDDGDDQVKQEQAPAFANLDKEFAEVFLDVEAADNKRDDQPGHTQGDPDGFRKGRNGKNDPGDNIGPGPMSGQVEDEEQEII